MQRLSSILRSRKNIFGNLCKSTRSQYQSAESQCENMGHILCQSVEDGKVTIEQVIWDIIEFTRSSVANCTSREVYFSWLALHLALGLCFKYKISDRHFVRNVLLELLLFGRGVDIGIFMRGLMENVDQSSQKKSFLDLLSNRPMLENEKSTSTSSQSDELLQKSIYFLKIICGFKINLLENEMAGRLFFGPCAREYVNDNVDGSCLYLELPLGHPSLLIGGAPISATAGSTALHMACENLKPKVVLVVLRHGASPLGHPLRFLFYTLECSSMLKARGSDMSLMRAPVGLVHECLSYCFRAIPGVRLCFVGETIADLMEKRKDRAYYINPRIAGMIPEDRYCTPARLKHLSRCTIRTRLLECDQDCLSDTIATLDVGVGLRNYLDLLE